MENMPELLSRTVSGDKIDRIKHIQSKINMISQNKIKNIKEDRFLETSNRINTIQDSANQMLKSFNQKIQTARQQIVDLQTKFENMSSQENMFIINRTQQINQIEHNFKKILSNIAKKTKENQKRIIEIYQEKTQFLYELLLREVEKRKIYFRKLDENLSNLLPQMNLTVKKDFESSSNRLKIIEDNINLQMQKLLQGIEQNKKIQQLSFQELLKMMGSVVSEVKQEIGIEKANREASKQKLLALFEEAYSKLVAQ